jgi:hypothetical protein
MKTVGLDKNGDSLHDEVHYLCTEIKEWTVKTKSKSMRFAFGIEPSWMVVMRVGRRRGRMWVRKEKEK